MFQILPKTFGGLDILVNSASVFSPATADKTTPEYWDIQMDTNAKAPFFVAQHAPRLMQARGGKIINIADVAGEVIWPGISALQCFESGVNRSERGSGQELRAEIQVNAIAPVLFYFRSITRRSKRRSAIERTLLKRAGKPARHCERGRVS